MTELPMREAHDEDYVSTWPARTAEARGVLPEDVLTALHSVYGDTPVGDLTPAEAEIVANASAYWAGRRSYVAPRTPADRARATGRSYGISGEIWDED